MFKVLEGSSGDVLGVEISQGYTQSDMEQFKQEFEKILGQGSSKVNILVKMDEMSVLGSEFKAVWKDSIYALKHMNQLRHIAIVGSSSALKAIIAVDNAIFGKKSEEREEKYFDLADMDKAWDFVRG